MIGDGYVAMGNVLSGEPVIDAMAAAYEAAAELSFERRLLAAIEAGRDAGGQAGNDGHLPERSAAVVVYGDYDHAELDLRVDLHDTAVEELRRAFEEYDLYRGYYASGQKNPKDAMPQYAFAQALARRAGGAHNDLLGHRTLRAHGPARPRHRHLFAGASAAAARASRPMSASARRRRSPTGPTIRSASSCWRRATCRRA